MLLFVNMPVTAGVKQGMGNNVSRENTLIEKKEMQLAKGNNQKLREII